MNLPLQAKYINPFTDYGFKRIFGEEPNKDLLKDFLNELLRDNEQLGRSQDERKSLFDIYCTNEKGDRFIVELQKTKQTFFKDRTLYYSTFPIVEQAQKVVTQAQLSSCVEVEQCSTFPLLRNFELNAVYTIAILDFSFDDDEDKDKYLYNVKLTEQETKKVFYDKLTFIYLSMPKFTKPLEELETHFDKWLYVFKNLHRLQEIPKKLQEEIFLKLFNTAEVAHLNRDEYMNYEASLKEYWDMTNSLTTSFEDGVEVGREEGIEIGESKKAVAIAQNLKNMGLDNQAIVKATGLTLTEIENI